MSDAVQIALITSITTALPILLGMWIAHLKQSVKIDKVVTEFNGMKDALVKGAEREGLAKGKLEGHADGVKDQKVAQAEKGDSGPASSRGGTVKLGKAVEQLTEAAQETVEAAEKTVEHAEKFPKK